MLYSVPTELRKYLPKYEHIHVFTTEKLKDIIEKPVKEIGTKQNWLEAQNYILDLLTQLANRQTTIKVYTGLSVDTYTERKYLLQAYKQVTTPFLLTTSYKAEVEYLNNIQRTIRCLHQK